MFTALGCHPSRYLEGKYADTCAGISHVQRLLVLAFLDIITEVIVTFLPIWICLSIQLSRAHQAQVIMGFGVRLTIVPFCTMYFYTVFGFLRDGESNIGLVPNLIWQQAFMSYSLILATAPCLRTFVKRFHTGGVRDIVGVRTRPSAPELVGCAETTDRSSGDATKRADSSVATRSASIAGLLKPGSIGASARSLVLRAPDIWTRHGDLSGKRHDGQSARPTMSRHWSQVFGAPSAKVERGTVVSTEDGWNMMEQHPDGWEKRRAEELMSAPKRTSVQTLEFITIADCH